MMRVLLSVALALIRDSGQFESSFTPHVEASAVSIQKVALEYQTKVDNVVTAATTLFHENYAQKLDHWNNTKFMIALEGFFVAKAAVEVLQPMTSTYESLAYIGNVVKYTKEAKKHAKVLTKFVANGKFTREVKRCKSIIQDALNFRIGG
jgi:hypothetical protein